MADDPQERTTMGRTAGNSRTQPGGWMFRPSADPLPLRTRLWWLILLGGGVLAITTGHGVRRLWEAEHWPGAADAGWAAFFLVMMCAFSVSQPPMTRARRIGTSLFYLVLVVLATAAMH